MADDRVPASRAPMHPRMRDLLDEFPVASVVDEAMAEVRAEVPAFRVVETGRMRADMAATLELSRQVIRKGLDDDGLEAKALRAIGALRAEQGMDMEEMLAAFRIIARVAIDTALGMARAGGIDPDVSLDFTRLVWGHCDAAARELAAGYRAYAEDPVRRPRPAGDVALRRLLHADGLTGDALAVVCADLGLSLVERYRLVVTRADASEPQVDARSRLLAHYVDLPERRLVGVVASVPVAAWDAPLAYGDLLAPGELHASVRPVQQAWEALEAFGVVEPRHPDEVVLLRGVLGRPDLGDELVQRAFGHLDEGRRESTVETLRAWFAAQGSTELAAELLFVHRNTLRYRLRVFCDASGLDLDHPEDAFAVWWAVRRLDLLDRGS